MFYHLYTFTVAVLMHLIKSVSIW